MLDRFCNWLDKTFNFTNAHLLIFILISIMFFVFMFETVDKYEQLEKYHNNEICSECGQVLHK